MQKINQVFRKIKLALSGGGLNYVVHRIPSMIFWTTVSTGLLIGVQFVFYNVAPAKFFIEYESPAIVRDTELGKAPILDYCSNSKDDYAIQVTAKLQKVTPPVYVQEYQVNTTIPKGQGCLSREVEKKPQTPGVYKIYYTVNATLPYGVHRYTTFETKAFNITTPSNIFSDYELTVLQGSYKPGSKLDYAFSGNQLVDTFGTTERYIVCDVNSEIVDSVSGRTTAGRRDVVNRLLKIPETVSGTCHMELRISSSVEGSDKTIAETLRSNDFAVQ